MMLPDICGRLSVLLLFFPFFDTQTAKQRVVKNIPEATHRKSKERIVKNCPTINGRDSWLNRQKFSRGLFEFAQIWYGVRPHDSRYTTNVHGHGVKGQGHSVT